MPLTWDATAVEDWDNVEPALKNTIDVMMMVTGQPVITETNAEEFYHRVSFYEKLLGAFRVGHPEEGPSVPVYFTPDECRQLIGYRTNVSTMTKAKFKNHIYSVFERENKF